MVYYLQEVIFEYFFLLLHYCAHNRYKNSPLCYNKCWITNDSRKIKFHTFQQCTVTGKRSRRKVRCPSWWKVAVMNEISAHSDNIFRWSLWRYYNNPETIYASSGYFSPLSDEVAIAISYCYWWLPLLNDTDCCYWNRNAFMYYFPLSKSDGVNFRLIMKRYMRFKVG